MTLIELMADAERIAVVNRVCGLVDEAMVDEKIAALYVGKSVQTLRRWRANEIGPEIWKGPAHLGSNEARSEGTNQAVQYRMQHLREFMAAGFVKSTSEGIGRNDTSIHKKVYYGFGSLQDLRDEHPWFQHILKDGKRVLIGHALATEPEEFERLWKDENVELVWLPVDEAMDRAWHDVERRAPFHKAYTEVLQGMLDASKSRQQTAEQFSSFNAKGKRTSHDDAEQYAKFDELSRGI